MTIRTIHQRLLFVCLFLAFASPALPTTLDLQAILDKTAISPPARVGFREVRHNRLLKEDLIFTGYLEYPQSGTLRKVIETPFEESYLMQSNRIEVQRNGETRDLSAQTGRALSTTLGGIEALFAGDAGQLMAVFELELSGTLDDWSLRLLPRSNRIARQLLGLTVSGDATSVRSIRFDLKDGEWHQMDIVHDAGPLQ